MKEKSNRKAESMKRAFLVIAVFIFQYSVSQSEFNVEYTVENPSPEINDAFIVVRVDGAEEPVHYYWSKSATDTTSDTSRKLTEGISHSVRIVDNAGNTYEETIYIPSNSIAEKFNGAFTPLVNAFGSVLLGDPFAALNLYDNKIYDEAGEVMLHPNGTPQTKSIPFIVVWLALGALFFTLRMGFINIRGFKHSIDLARGRYDEPHAPGEVTHFQALAAAVSATVGLGNIAGVAVAVSIGGAGATF